MNATAPWCGVAAIDRSQRASTENSSKITNKGRKLRRALARYKRKYRAANAERVKEQRSVDNAKCADLDRLKRFVAMSPDRPGCWIWTGRFIASRDKIKPLVTAGEYGGMLADRAMWKALTRPDLIGRNYLLTTCGHFDCVSPDHLYVTNQTMERARAALGERA